MANMSKIRRTGLRTAIAAALTAGLMAAAPSAPALAQGTLAPANDVTLSVGTGRMVRPSGQVAEVFVADENIADVHASTPSQIYIFGKAAGSTTVYATDRSGRVVYSANVRVGQNLGSVSQMLDLAMPEADITATPMNGMVLLTGTVAQPTDAAEAERLVKAFVGQNVEVVSRLRTATPQQVYLQVRIAEVSRTLARDIGTNLLSRDNSGGFLFGLGRGNPGTITTVTQANDPSGLPIGSTAYTFNNPATSTTLGAAGRLLGMDLLGTLNLGETTGQVVTLAEPTLVALSGESATFLAGGEFPVPIPQSLGTVTIEYKQYGVGLAFSPTVLENGRISIRVRPEVSELSATGSVRFNGFEIPSLTTRRVETTVELGSGQSFVIGGLLRNSNSNSIDRAPGLGNIPIIGALFRSTRYRREETELMIVVTPYLVRPVSANQVALPTDGYRNPDEASRLILGTTNASRNEPRPMPSAAEPRTVRPGITTGAATPPDASSQASGGGTPAAPAARPGFSF